MINLKIKEIREHQNLTKDYIAIQLEISLKKYNEIEKGIVEIKMSRLIKLIEILGIQKVDLF